MKILGLDIGGANIKGVLLNVGSGGYSIEAVFREYFPIWILGKNALEEKLKSYRESLPLDRDYYVGVCMTAELSDIYRVKREGVHHIVDSVVDAYRDAKWIGFVSVDKVLLDSATAKERFLRIAAANWAASAWLLEKFCSQWGVENSIFIDIGSTTTTIIPIYGCRTVVRGYTDPEKLVYGELVYTGVLRTNISTIVDRAPYKGLWAKVCSERFALSGDVHLVLGYISSDEYTTETADGRGRSVGEAVDRLARVVCSDSEIMNFYEVKTLARYVYEVQLFKIVEALLQVKSYIASIGVDPDSFKVISAGIGSYMVREAARRAGFREVIDIGSIVGEKVSPVLPAYGAALMILESVKNRVE